MTVSGKGLVPGEGTELGGVTIHELDLEASRTTRTYRQRLLFCLTCFLQWIARRQVMVVGDWWDNVDITNQLLVEFVSWTKEEKWAIWKARHAILAVQTMHHPLKGKLGRAWNCLRSWQMTIPTLSRIPMPVHVLRAMFITALLFASEEPHNAALWYSFAVLVRVGHEGLLRPGEMTELRAADFRLPQSAWEPLVAVVTILDAKNRASLGRYQFVLLDQVATVRWVEWLLSGLPYDTKLWGASHYKFCTFFQRVLARLRLTRLGLTLGSLRPGGATAHFMQHKSIPVLRIAGRWKVESSLESYIQTTMAHLAFASLSDKEHHYVSSLLRLTEQQWLEPPAPAWDRVFSRRKQWRASSLPSVQRRQAALQRRNSMIWQDISSQRALLT